MKILDIPEENRPRERMLREGPKALNTAELLAVILRTGTRKENAVEMSNRLIAEYGTERLSSLSAKELQKIHGIGPAKALQIAAAFELSKRSAAAEKLTVPIKTARDAYEYLKARIPAGDRENLMILYLDSKNRVIKDEHVSMGTLNSALIHPREVFKTAIKECTNTIIIAHNHPSGDPAPSKDDREITKQLKKAGEYLEIELLDHIIIGEGRYFSFRESGGF